MNSSDNDNEIMVVSTKLELLGQGYMYANVGKEFVYGETTFLLKEAGIRKMPVLPFMGYPHVCVIPRKPTWQISVNDMELIVRDIK
jgi:hypothetical protein